MSTPLSEEHAREQLVLSGAREKPNAVARIFTRTRGDSPAKRFAIHLVLIVASIIAIYPAIRIFTISLGPFNQSMIDPFTIIPPNASLENYTKLIANKGFFTWLVNSLIVTVAVSIVGLVMSATGAYAFSRWKFRGRTAGLIFLLSTQMIPAGMVLVPVYLMLARLGQVNHYSGLMLAYVVTAIPFSIWILKGYYDTVPRELEEAALIDGCNQLETFYRIVLPLSTPALAVVFLNNFMAAWSEFAVAFRIITNKSLYTWPLGIKSLQGQFQTEWGMYAAASVMVMIPVILLFMYSSKYLISGLTVGSVKG
jgi:arabinogalactan oligomer / maltooligosaccharide transport system permease protein